MKRGACAVAALFLVSACTAGPDYARPERDAPPHFMLQEVLGALNDDKTAAPLAADWWRGFNDPLLDGLVATALADNLDIAEALGRVAEARADLRAAGADYRPQTGLAGGGDASREHDLTSGDHRDNSASADGFLGLSITPDLWGKGRRDREAALAQLNGTKAALRGVVLDTSVAVAREYLLLRGNQQQLALLRESVELQEKTLTIVQSRYRAGLAPELDVRRAETSVESLRANIPDLEQELRRSRHALAVLAGLYPGGLETNLTKAAPVPSYGRAVPALVPLALLDARPDVAAAEEALKAAIAAIGIAEADYFPELTLSGQIGLGVSAASGMGAMDVLIGAVSAALEQVLTDGGARRARLEGAKARADQALARYELTLRRAVEEVENALSAIKASHDRQGSLGKAEKASARSFYQAEILYRRGLISFLDVVDAQRVLANARQQLAREETTYATRIADLFAALGAEVTRPEPTAP